MDTKHEARLVQIDSLRMYEGNPRRGDIPTIRESLRLNGQYRPVVVRTETQEILAGNHTWEAARQEGWTEIWATFISCDEQSARRINLVDNRAPELGGYDAQALASMLLQEPDGLEGTGWTEQDLEKLVGQLEASAPDGQDLTGQAVGTPGVLVLCESTREQENVLAALQAAAQGDSTFLAPVLKDLEIQTVVV